MQGTSHVVFLKHHDVKGYRVYLTYGNEVRCQGSNRRSLISMSDFPSTPQNRRLALVGWWAILSFAKQSSQQPKLQKLCRPYYMRTDLQS